MRLSLIRQNVYVVGKRTGYGRDEYLRDALMLGRFISEDSNNFIDNPLQRFSFQEASFALDKLEISREEFSRTGIAYLVQGTLNKAVVSNHDSLGIRIRIAGDLA